MRNKTVFSIGLTLLTFQFFFNSCAKLSEEELMEDFVYCKDSLVSYQNNVQPILNVDCVPCHSGPGAENGVELDSYANLIGTTDSASLMGVINHKSGFVPMPSGKPKINECKISTIQKWINEGMMDN